MIEADAALSPIAVTALRVMLYEVLFVSPVIVIGLVASAGESAVKFVPSMEYL